MIRLLKDENLVASWQNFFEEHCRSDIETIALQYPENRSLQIDYWKVDKADPKLSELLINQPYKAVFNAETALQTVDVAAQQKMKLHFRVTNLSDTDRLLIRKIRASHLGKLCAIEGLVKTNSLSISTFTAASTSSIGIPSCLATSAMDN